MKEANKAASVSAVAVVVFLLAGRGVRAEPPPARLLAAREAMKKALAVEEKVYAEFIARAMARSATREIALSARNTAERALQNLLSAQEILKDKTARSQGAAAAVWEKTVADRFTTLRAAADRMINDQRVANMANDDVVLVEKKIAAQMQASRAAERVVLVLEAEAARSAAQQALARKAANAQELLARAKSADKAVLEVDVVAALEALAWLVESRVTFRQMATGHEQAMELTQRLLAHEPDAARQRTYRAFLDRIKVQKQPNEKGVQECTRAIRALDWKILSLRVTAMGGLKLIDPASWDRARARHLLVRAGFGGTPQQVDRLHAMGPFRAAEYLVHYQRQPAARVPFDPGPPPRPDPIEAKLRNDRLRRNVGQHRRNPDSTRVETLRLWWLKRLVESPRPLQEKLTLFWHGHFATQYSVVQNSFTTYHQNQLFRQHAAGNFGGLLTGLVHDPVMLRYLDNNTNVKGHANENLAREILELFAMGEGQGYTEKDIREAARALTGYTFDHFTGQFRFLVKNHDDKPKTVFGKTGNWSGDDLVTLILEQPATARFIARKLFEYFAYADPAAATVEPLAAVLREQQYELSPLLMNLFLSEEFYSERAVATQIKSPVQLLTGLMRDLGIREVDDYRPLDAGIRAMGQQLLEPPDVKGWRGGRTWINADRLFARYNTVADLIHHVARPGQQKGVDVLALLDQSRCQTAEEVVDYLIGACFTKPLGAQKRAELVSHLGSWPPPDQRSAQRDQLNQRLRQVLVLMLCTPEYQMG
ncbi:MAG: DUF1800 family protein [Gemmataceae bacterium]|nr:DUF1800 family protein [Gemmataceae bacterium]